MEITAFRVRKIDAARAQLRTAISLWFTNGDPVSIHTLGYAAHEIIHRLFRKGGLKGLMFDSERMTEEEREAFVLDLKGTANFFKHANQDASEDTDIVFFPDSNELFFGACISGLVQMDIALLDVEWAYTYWRALHDKRWLSIVAERGMTVNFLQQFGGIDREQFFPSFLTHWRARYGTGGIKASVNRKS